MDNTEWIASLKIGDKVALVHFFSHDDYVGIATVTGRTPKRIRCDEKEYDLDGRQRGRSYQPRLAQYCDAACSAVAKLRAKEERALRHGELVGKFMHLGWEQIAALPDATLEALAKLLDDGLAAVEAAKKAAP